MSYKTIYVDVRVDVDEILSEVDTSDLLKELKRREMEVIDNAMIETFLEVIYNKRRTGIDYSQDLDEMIYQYLGKVV